MLIQSNKKYKDSPYLYRMKRSGTADLPLHYGKVPPWLYERMSALGLSIVEVILMDYGKDEVLRRLADPFWFQSFGAVMGMDWHSSGITTSVMGALKRSINPNSQSLGLYICGGKGKFSRETPSELLQIADKTGLDGNKLVKASKLSAKVDNTAIQDGYQLYLHNFILSDNGNWSVVQQGMHESDGTARRYHWHSGNITSFVEEPHTGINGISRGKILNLTDAEASDNRKGILEISHTDSAEIMSDFSRLILPNHHEVRASDKLRTLNKLHQIIEATEKDFTPDFDIQEVIEEERQNSWRFGGKTVFGDAQKPSPPKPIQLSLF